MEKLNFQALKASIQLEEDLFPMHFTSYHEKDYGVLFFNTSNKTSYDSNHAVIFKDKIEHLGSILDEITHFYQSKGIQPSIYQSLGDEGYFETNKDIFTRHGYNVWMDTPAQMMVLKDENAIEKASDLDIRLLDQWDNRIADDICIPSGEEYEIEVFRNSLASKSSSVFVAYKDNKAVAALHYHLSDFDCCRYDYILVNKEERNKGYGQSLLSYVTDYCRQNDVSNCYQWPAHEHSEAICYQAGFRHLFTAEIGRASYVKKGAV